MPDAATEFLTTIWRALGGEAKSDARVEFTGEGALPSVFVPPTLPPPRSAPPRWRSWSMPTQAPR
jgi:hypothetical protein